MDDRALSSAVTYALTVVIALSLTTGIVFGAEALIDSQREQTAREQVEVVGEQLGKTLSTAGGLNATDAEPETLVVERSFPERVAGSQYQILVAESDAGPDRYVVYLETVDFDVNVSVAVRLSAADLRRARVNGGPLRVRYHEPTRQLVVERA